MSLSIIEAYDIVRYSELLQARLAAGQAVLAAKRGLKPEKEWLTAAQEIVRVAREPTAGLLERVKALPELDEVRDEFTLEYQNQWVDLLEKLLAGITFHAGSRSPAIEALFPHQKFPLLRKPDREAVESYANEFERRLRSSYVSRMFAQPEFAFAAPVLEQLAAARGRWAGPAAGESPPAEQVAEWRKELLGTARRLEPALRQARLLAEAALVPVPGGVEEAGLSIKPKKRTPKGKAEGAAAAEANAEGGAAAATSPAEPATEAAAPVAAPAESTPPEAPRVAPADAAPVAAPPAADLPSAAQAGGTAGSAPAKAKKRRAPAPPAPSAPPAPNAQ